MGGFLIHIINTSGRVQSKDKMDRRLLIVLFAFVAYASAKSVNQKRSPCGCDCGGCGGGGCGAAGAGAAGGIQELPASTITIPAGPAAPCPPAPPPPPVCLHHCMKICPAPAPACIPAPPPPPPPPCACAPPPCACGK